MLLIGFNCSIIDLLSLPVLFDLWNAFGVPIVCCFNFSLILGFVLVFSFYIFHFVFRFLFLHLLKLVLKAFRYSGFELFCKSSCWVLIEVLVRNIV